METRYPPSSISLVCSDWLTDVESELELVAGHEFIGLGLPEVPVDGFLDLTRVSEAFARLAEKTQFQTRQSLWPSDT